jgi:hypothetical protein
MTRFGTANAKQCQVIFDCLPFDARLLVFIVLFSFFVADESVIAKSAGEARVTVGMLVVLAYALQCFA